LNQNCRSQVRLVFDDTVVGKAARTTRDPAAPFRTTLLNDAGAALGPMRLFACGSRHSFSRRDFRTGRMLSQEILRSSKPLLSRDKRNWSAFFARSGYSQPISK
jgi:hypothetical protein